MTFKAKFVIFALILLPVALGLWKLWHFVNGPLAREEMRGAIKSQAQQMIDAMCKGDLQTWADLTLPDVIDQSGGREKWIEALKSWSQLNELGDVNIGSGRVGEPMSITERQSVQYAVIRYAYDFTLKRAGWVKKSVLIGVSKDGGRNWKFTEGSYNRNRVEAVLPDFPKEIQLPKREELGESVVVKAKPIARKRPKALPKDETKPLASEELNVRLKTQAQELFDAVVKGDLKSLEDRTLPEAIEYHEGRDKWLNGIKENLKLHQKVGITYDRIKAGEITATKSGNPECYGVIAYELASTFEGKKSVAKGSLIGASTDGGRNWTFIAGGGFATAPGLDRYMNVSELIPDWPKELPIPE